MTRYSPLWQQANAYPAGLDRLLVAALWPRGGATGAALSAVANTMNVTIPPGTVAVPLQAGQGAALCAWDAAEVVTLAAAPPAGQTRIDLVIAQVRDNAIDGGPNNDFVFAVVTGVPAANNPAVPATPANAAALCQVTVPAAAANLNGATVTERRAGTLDVPGVVAQTIGAAIDAGQGQTVCTLNFLARQGRRYRITGRAQCSNIWASVPADGSTYGWVNLIVAGTSVQLARNDAYASNRQLVGSTFQTYDQVAADAVVTATMTHNYGGNATGRFAAGASALLAEDIGAAR